MIDTTAFDEFNEPENDTMYNLFTYENMYAKAYIAKRYGRIKIVESCVDGISDKKCNYLGKDCTGYTMNAFSLMKAQKNLYIGEKMRKQLLIKKEQEYKEICMKKSELEQQGRVSKTALASIKKIYEKANRNGQTDTLYAVENLPNEIRDLNKRIADFKKKNNLDALDKKKTQINNQIEDCNKKKDELDRERNKLIRDEGGYRNELAHAEAALSEIEPIYEENRMNNVVLFNEAIEKYKEKCKDKRRNYKTISDEIKKENDRLDDEMVKVNRKLKELQEEYVSRYNPNLHFNGIDVANEYEEEYDKYVLEGYAETKEKLKKAAEESRKAINEGLLSSIRSSINEANEKNKKINKELEKHKFGAKTYKILDIKPVSGDAEIIYKVAMANNGMLSDNSNSGYTQEEYDKAIELLLNNKNYLDYRELIETEMTVTEMEGGKLTKKKLQDAMIKASGGELQVPFYMIMAIALNNLYEEVSYQSCFRFLMMDEAFYCMDNDNITAMVNFLKGMGYQIMVAAPDSKNEVFKKLFNSCIVAINNKEEKCNEYYNYENNTGKKYLNFAKLSEDEGDTEILDGTDMNNDENAKAS